MGRALQHTLEKLHIHTSTKEESPERVFQGGEADGAIIKVKKPLPERVMVFETGNGFSTCSTGECAPLFARHLGVYRLEDGVYHHVKISS